MVEIYHLIDRRTHDAPGGTYGGGGVSRSEGGILFAGDSSALTGAPKEPTLARTGSGWPFFCSYPMAYKPPPDLPWPVANST